MAVDGSRAAETGLREAARIAEADRAGLIILHVVNELQINYAMRGAWVHTEGLLQRLRANSHRILEKARKLVARRGLEPKLVMRHVADASPGRAIVREAKSQGADLIVLGTHGRRGMKRLVMGSDAEEVVRTAPVPVLLVRAQTKR